ISPEGCAAILWRSADQRDEAARALKLTSADLLDLGVADRIVPEPPGGAHSDWDETAQRVARVLSETLDELEPLETEELLEARWAKFEAMGEWEE
nr:acetyl-CoA carboxylase carboxyl transferase subunit alpha [Gemmatimonadota bacterium]NIR80154.1 acetyl-CoA carboxylase carboxyl transferase subunit alpha [Gemmatimonadota bacterium]NIT88911.1 acetyl-CoA carboxylase carboxyl transferase subunit alpha [Gemmatimonadota bacterium]NIU32710.1 acetyl-CoA carboxylase carboxyl transferase subunit alpha [Gemmatimonadota bacterium]NIU37145.1 acetyl-CoA carboxylase carboxyl transferase subunit alpha [Gemmatimonadota bacterium]